RAPLEGGREELDEGPPVGLAGWHFGRYLQQLLLAEGGGVATEEHVRRPAGGLGCVLAVDGGRQVPSQLALGGPLLGRGAGQGLDLGVGQGGEEQEVA